MERRTFFRTLGAGLAAYPGMAGAVALAEESLRRLRDDLKTPHDEAALWSRVRVEFALNPSLVHLNTGTLGATPRKVIDAISAWMYEIEGDPASNVFGALGGRMEEVRAKAAEFLGARLDEIALTENTTSGMNAVAQGLRTESQARRRDPHDQPRAPRRFGLLGIPGQDPGSEDHPDPHARSRE